MYTSLLIALFVYVTINTNGATRVNLEVTLPQKDLFSLFTIDEIWGFEYVNKTSNMVKVNIVIDKSKHKSLLQSSTASSNIVSIKTIYPNVESVLQQEFNRLKYNKTRWKYGDNVNDFFDDYRDWIEYEAFIEYFLLTNDNIASQSFLGTTIQGRNIPLITLSSGDSTSNKPGFFIQAELHGNEWLANAATLFIMNELAQGYQNGDATITEILENVNIYIAPTVNIDGYIYSWLSSNNRNWRKNRRNNGDGSFGVDLNRNYDNPQFCGPGSSSNPSNNNYCGTAPLSEPESAASAAFMTDSDNNIQAFFDMHTFGPLILYPWGYTLNRAPDYEFFVEYGDELQDVVEGVNGHFYRSQQAAELYPAAGGADDYAYIEGIKMSICFEGRGPGFNPPPSNIIPAGEEQYAAVIATAQRLF